MKYKEVVKELKVEMKKFVTKYIEFLFKFLFLFLLNITFINADYEYKYTEDLSLRDIAYIQNLTEYADAKSQFAYAQTLDLFDIEKLSFSDKKMLIGLLRKSGIVINRKAYKDKGTYVIKMKKEISKYNDTLQVFLDKSTYESTSISNLNVSDWLELGWNTGLNMVSAVSDVVGVGMYVKALRAAKVIQKASYINKIKSLKDFHQNAIVYKKVIDTLEVFNSKSSILMSNLINNGFVLTNQMKTEINTDKLLKEQLNGLGISVLGKLSAGKLSNSVKGTVSSAFIGKFFETTSILLTRLVSGLTTGDKGQQIFKDILQDLQGLIPIYGPFKQQWDKSSEIFDRIDESPEALVAWKNYLNASKAVNDKINQLINKDLELKLKPILNYANSINLSCYSDISKNHRSYIPILTLKMLDIIDGYIVERTGAIEYRPDNYATIGQFLKGITKIKFPDYRNAKTNLDYKKFLEDKKININFLSNKILQDSDLSKNITRGHLSKIIMNIDLYKINQHNKKCYYSDNTQIIDDEYIRVDGIEICEDKVNETIEDTYPQIKTCKATKILDWDECSDYIRFRGITKSINKFYPKNKVTRNELALFLYRTYIGLLAIEPKFIKIRGDVK